MKPHRQKRLGIILFIAAGLSVAVGLTLFALRQNINMFYTPTQVAAGEVASGVQFRIGGMVKAGTIQEDQGSLRVSFVTTDYSSDVPVQYEGILPDLFAEGEGVVAEGVLNEQGMLIASEVLAKHDENYMPPEVAAALEGKSPEAKSLMP